MVRKMFIILMTLGVILPAPFVCAFARDCGGSARGVVANEPCADGPGHATVPGAHRDAPSNAAFSTHDECCCPNVGPNEVRQAVVIISTPPVNGQDIAFARSVQRIEASLQQLASMHSRQSVVVSSVFPPKLYRLYSSYLI